MPPGWYCLSVCFVFFNRDVCCYLSCQDTGKATVLCNQSGSAIAHSYSFLIKRSTSAEDEVTGREGMTNSD